VSRPDTDPFRPAKLLVNKARADFEDFNKRCATFIAQCKFDVLIDKETDPFSVIVKARRVDVGAVPDELEAAAIVIIGSLRSALDKAVHAAALVLGSDDLKKAPFPFGDSAVQFATQLASKKGPWIGIPKQLHQYFIDLGPHPDKTPLLKEFGEVSNPAKHEAILTIDAYMNGIGIGSGTGSAVFTSTRQVWDEKKSELEFCRIRKPFVGSFKIMPVPQVVLNTGKRIRGEPFFRFMCDVIWLVDSAVKGIEAETLRLSRG
jgi:hypothetical protein